MTAKLRVAVGCPLQDNAGERSSPPAPMMPLTWGGASGVRSATSVLVSVSVGSSGRNPYGLGWRDRRCGHAANSLFSSVAMNSACRADAVLAALDRLA